MLTAPKRSIYGQDSPKNRAAHHFAELIDVDVVQVHGRGDGHAQRGVNTH